MSPMLLAQCNLGGDSLDRAADIYVCDTHAEEVCDMSVISHSLTHKTSARMLACCIARHMSAFSLQRVQGSAKRWAPGCVNAVGKVRQKW